MIRVPAIVRHGAILALVAVVAAAVVIAIGLFPVSARLGHLPGVGWLLHTTYQRSVDFWSAGIDPPPLDDPALVQLGAAHFESGCRACHGAPGIPNGAVAAAMLPPPPHIRNAIKGWDDAELYWIVREGVKMSGMPHWPAAARDDEPWALVAFLRRVPRIRGTEYIRLAQAPAGRVAELGAIGRVANCARCHGMDGVPPIPGVVPRIDGLSAAYLAQTLRAYAERRRDSGIMAVQAVGLSEAEIAALARHYAAAPVAAMTVAAPTKPALVEQGRRIALGVSARRLPACAACHGPGTRPKSPLFPVLAGQPQAYLARQLQFFRARDRGGTSHVTLMFPIARQLEDEDIDALAAYYASLRRGG